MTQNKQYIEQQKNKQYIEQQKNKQYIEQQKNKEQHRNYERVRAVPHLCGFYPGICLITEEKARKNLSQGRRRVPDDTMKIHKHTIRIHRHNYKNT